jgi:hypothetical protein
MSSFLLVELLQSIIGHWGAERRHNQPGDRTAASSRTNNCPPPLPPRFDASSLDPFPTRISSRRGPHPMQQRHKPCLLGLLAAVIALLAASAAHACPGHGSAAGDDAVARWDRELVLKGRRRSLLSLEGRRWVEEERRDAGEDGVCAAACVRMSNRRRQR